MGVTARFLRALASTALARLRRGPLRPTWPFMFEAMVATLRETSREVAARSPLEERAAWAEMKPLPARVMRAVGRAKVDAGGVAAEWFVPKAGASNAVVLFVHGGSFIYGSLTSHGEMIARIALATGARVLALDYRLAPEHPFPAALDDVVAAYRWLLAQGVAPGRVVFMGDSAGGNLALTALLRARGEGLVAPAGVAPISPWVDLARRGGSLVTNMPFDWGVADAFPRWAETYAPGRDLRDPLLSPLYGDFAGAPPLLVTSGECEMLRDQVEDFVARARASGADVTHRTYPDMVHNWLVLHAFTPEAQRAYDDLGAFVRRVTGRA